MYVTERKEVETMKKITRIEATDGSVRPEKKLRVAAYARVSTDSREQLVSLEAQKKHYENYIKSNPKWTYVGLYYDEGITGTHMEKRDGLKQLITDCEKGLIDFVVIKSISRFARNTTECLEVVRKLLKLKIYIYFEKENLNTGDMDGELLLTIFSSLAESESVSISENIRWSTQKRFENGTFIVGSPPYGYRNVNGQMVIDEEEAKIVRYIFSEYLSGKGGSVIAKDLQLMGAPSRRNGSWNGSVVLGIIKNEKYVGDVLLQKTYTDSDFRRHINNGEKAQYYVENHHEPIISHEDFDRAQQLLAARAGELSIDPGSRKFLNRYVFSGKIKCGECGASWKRRKQSKGNEPYFAYSCTTHLKDKNKCGMMFIREDDVKNAFINMLNKLRFGRLQILQPLHDALEQNRSDDDIDRINALEERLEENFNRRQTLMNLLTKQYLEPGVFAKENAELLAEAETLKGEKDALLYSTNSLLEKAEAVAELQRFIGSLPIVKEFDEEAFEKVVDHIIVLNRGEVAFFLKCGLTLKERL